MLKKGTACDDLASGQTFGNDQILLLGYMRISGRHTWQGTFLLFQSSCSIVGWQGRRSAVCDPVICFTDSQTLTALGHTNASACAVALMRELSWFDELVASHIQKVYGCF